MEFAQSAIDGANAAIATGDVQVIIGKANALATRMVQLTIMGISSDVLALINEQIARLHACIGLSDEAE